MLLRKNLNAMRRSVYGIYSIDARGTVRFMKLVHVSVCLFIVRSVVFFNDFARI